MKTIRFVLCTTLLVVLATGVSAFWGMPTGKAREMYQQMNKNATKRELRSYWNGDGEIVRMMGYLQHKDFREGLGISDSQFHNIQEIMMQDASMDMSGNMIMPPPQGVELIHEEIGKLMEKSDPFAEDASEETRKKFLDLDLQLHIKTNEAFVKRATKAVNENLTPDQMKKYKEFQISIMSESLHISPSMFEALDLSDTQKKQLDEIKVEMEPEYEKWIDMYVEMELIHRELRNEHFEKLTKANDYEKQRELSEEFMRKPNPEMAKIRVLRNEFANRLKSRVFDILTAAQKERVTDLIDNPPEYVKKMLSPQEIPPMRPLIL